MTFLAKAEYFDSKKTAWFFRAAGQIPIHRGGGSASSGRSRRPDRSARERAAPRASTPRAPGPSTSTCTRVAPGSPGSRASAVYPIIPVGVVGTVEVQPVNSNFMRPFKKVTIRFGKPMEMDPPVNPDDPLEGHDHTECRSFTDYLMHEIARLSEREYVDEYVPARRPRHRRSICGSVRCEARKCA